MDAQQWTDTLEPLSPDEAAELLAEALRADRGGALADVGIEGLDEALMRVAESAAFEEPARVRAAELLGRREAAAMAPRLADLLTGESEIVAVSAAWMLRELAWQCGRSVDGGWIRERLCAAAGLGGARARGRAAAGALCLLADRAGAAPLLDLLSDPSTQGETAAEAISWLLMLAELLHLEPPDADDSATLRGWLLAHGNGLRAPQDES